MHDALEILTLSDVNRWESLLSAMPNADVYWHPAYLAPLEQEGHGRAHLAAFPFHGHLQLYAYMERDISGAGGLKDITTPYGYGGLLATPGTPETLVRIFRESFAGYCRDAGIVTEFIRFHPVLENVWPWAEYVDAQMNRHTYGIPMNEGIDLLQQMDPSARNKVRKSEKHGIQVEFSNSPASLTDFSYLYYQTMDRNGATAFYYLSEEFFQATLRGLGPQCTLALAKQEDRVVAASMLLQGTETLHYHLSGIDSEFRNTGAQNRLLYEAALWGRERGLKVFHLGGGVTPEDSLAGFKRSMGSCKFDFWLGRCIYSPDLYRELVSLREAAVGPVLEGFFPAYRAPGKRAEDVPARD